MPRSSARRKEVVGFELAFKADGVQVHVLDKVELVAKAAVVGAQQHVLRPARAANENRLAIHAKEAAAVGCQFGSDFADAEVDALFVGGVPFGGEADCECSRCGSPIWRGHQGFGFCRRRAGNCSGLKTTV